MSEPRVWTITLTHLDLPILERSLEAYYATAKPVHHQHVLVDHHWPIGYWKHRHSILDLGEKHGCKVMAPYENVGGHNGYNWMLLNCPLHEGDYFMGFDGDSFPVTPGWDKAMFDVMGDKRYGAVSLSINANLDCKEWVEEEINGVWVKRPARGIEMINVTMWRCSLLNANNGFGGLRPYYGFVEHIMFAKMNEMGLKHGYLRDYSEDLKSIQPHPSYTDWKMQHVMGKFGGNFSHYCKEKGIQ